MAKLTIKQEAFVKEYLLNGGNATQAAITAGYSKKTANEQGAQNLAKLSIKKAIQEHQKQTQKDFIWSKEKKLALLEQIALCATTADPEKGMLNMPSAIAALKEHNLMQGDNAPITINPLDPVVQLAILPLVQAKFKLVTKFGMKTKRGEGGFGHTDKLKTELPKVLDGISDALKQDKAGDKK